MDPALEEELDVLASMFAPEELRVTPLGGAPALPPGVAARAVVALAFGGDAGAAMVRATLTLLAPVGYPVSPAAPLRVELPPVRGLPDAEVARVRAAVAALAAAAAAGGETCMFQAVTEARERLGALATAVECCVCLEPVELGAAGGGGGGGGDGGAALVNRACGHGFHAACLARWVAHLLAAKSGTADAELRRTSARQAIGAVESRLTAAAASQRDLTSELALLATHAEAARADAARLAAELAAVDTLNTYVVSTLSRSQR